MGQRTPVSGVGSSSIASPITLKRRPRVSTPTGTEIGDPVAVTGWPRRIPSVESMAIVRTTLSPLSDCPSSTMRRSPTFVSRASNSSGAWPASNSTSTTAPMTSTILPNRVAFFFSSARAFVFAIEISFLARRAHGCGAADNVDQFGRDALLANLVREEGQRFDQVAGRVGPVLHRDHLGRVLAGLVLEHGLEHLRLDVPRQQPVQD